MRIRRLRLRLSGGFILFKSRSIDLQTYSDKVYPRSTALARACRKRVASMDIWMRTFMQVIMHNCWHDVILALGGASVGDAKSRSPPAILPRDIAIARRRPRVNALEAIRATLADIGRERPGPRHACRAESPGCPPPPAALGTGRRPSAVRLE